MPKPASASMRFIHAVSASRAGARILAPLLLPVILAAGVVAQSSVRRGPELRPGPLGAEPNYTCSLDSSTLLFAADDGSRGRELWIRKNAGNPVLLKDVRPGTQGSDPRGLARIGSRVLFTADDGMHGRELWITDGTAAGTTLLADMLLGPIGSDPGLLSTAVGSRVYFAARTGSATSDRELWSSDGTAVGTRLVLDLLPGDAGSNPAHFAALDEKRVAFAATTTANGREIWSSDGTRAGTTLLVDIVPGALSSDPSDLTSFRDGLLFAAFEAKSGREPWFYDAKGASMLEDIEKGSGSSDPRSFEPGARKGERALFSATTVKDGREIYITDGSKKTDLVQDLNVGAASSDPTHFTSVGTRTWFFSADDGTSNGRELYEYDERKKTHRLVGNINPTGAADPQMISEGGRMRFHVSERDIVFSANDGTTGSEFWLSGAGAVAWTVEPGCGTKTRVPRLSAEDPVLGTNEEIYCENIKTGTAAGLIFGFIDPTPTLIRNTCFLHFDLNQYWTVIASWVQTSGNTKTHFIPIPNLDRLVGFRFALQLLVLPTEAPLGFELSNGVYAIKDRF